MSANTLPKEKKSSNKNETVVKSNFKPKSFFKDDSSYNQEGAKLLFEVDSFLKPLYTKYLASGHNIREIQQIFNIAITNNEVENSVKLTEDLYKEARQKMLDERTF